MNHSDRRISVLLALITAVALIPAAIASSIGGATGTATADGKALIASNGDNGYQFNARLVVRDPDDGYKYVGNIIVAPEGTPPSPWTNMVTRGLNEAGFAYSWTYVSPQRDEPSFANAWGVTFEQFGRMILSQAANVEEAIALVEEYPRAYHGNFIFADADGNMALLEISTESYEVIMHDQDGVAYRANHWLHPNMQELRDPPPDMSDSGWRQSRLEELFEANRGNITEQTLMRIFSDTHGALEHGWSIESHRCDPETDVCRSGTTSSDVMSPSDLTFWWSWGWGSGMQPRFPEQKNLHDRSWGVYVPFYLPAMEPGEYATTESRLTPLAIRYIMDHFGISTPTMEIGPIEGQTDETWERTR